MTWDQNIVISFRVIALNSHRLIMPAAITIVTRPRGTAQRAAPRPRSALWRKADLIRKRWRSLFPISTAPSK